MCLNRNNSNNDNRAKLGKEGLAFAELRHDYNNSTSSNNNNNNNNDYYCIC